MDNITGTDIWYTAVPDGMENIVFNGGTTQTADLVIPTDGKNLYAYDTGSWSYYN